MPFQGGELEETYFTLHDLGFDGFSTDYPRMDRTRTVIARTRGFFVGRTREKRTRIFL